MSTETFKQRFVLDTSLFVTEEIRREDESLEEAVLRLLDLIAHARLNLGISCYVPPTIHDELTTMLEARGVAEEVYAKLNTWVVRKHPDRYGLEIPANVVYSFVDEMSDRVDRGLRVSEEAVRRAERASDEPLEDHEHKTEVDAVISDLRDKYRGAMRTGVLDSREDFDLLILARELDAGVVTEDRGIIDWTEDFGLRYIRGREFPDLLEQYLATVDPEEKRTID
ncbi:RNA ligase partner protein [Halobiforma lacisalsi AJ5]|uniref:RNA-free ribonuclease P n=1 Tax=Natronobacterium lacisalsi AJ5 TaxID=358396 RepID=M0L893_NATLA|nr:RNA ligase partner protein [Halobiforma lacisalsi]APW98163.1 RNA ligase partner protein [Halobiforma lacisalsi AJ5]EMA28145.1 hypothetical protein C445_18938 [Halobiforma lacisalsi AJ5]